MKPTIPAQAFRLSSRAVMLRLLLTVVCLFMVPSWDAMAKDTRGAEGQGSWADSGCGRKPNQWCHSRAWLHHFPGSLATDAKEEEHIVNGAYDFTRDDVVNLEMKLEKDGYYYSVPPIPIIAWQNKETSCVNGIQTIENDVILEPLETDLPDLMMRRDSINEISTDSLYCLNTSTLKKEECRRGATHTTGPQGLETGNSCPECQVSSCVLFVERQTRIADGANTRSAVP